MSAIKIDERGWTTTLIAPELPVADREGRLRQVGEVFRALDPILRPLALEIRQDWRSADTGGAISKEFEPAVVVLAKRGASQVNLRRFYDGNTEPTPVANFSSETLRLHLRHDRPGQLMADWTEIRSMACEVRGIDTADHLEFAQIGRIDASAENWFTGPQPDTMWPSLPPAQITITSEYGLVQLELTVLWPPWRYVDRAEYAAVQQSIGSLRDSGWHEPEG